MTQYARLAALSSEDVDSKLMTVRTRNIMQILMGTSYTYQEVADRYGLTKQRVGQIALRAGIRRKRGRRPGRASATEQLTRKEHLTKAA